MQNLNPPRINHGCVFFNYGSACVLRLLVAIYTLRKYYDGPVSVLLVEDDNSDRLARELELLHCQVIYIDQLSKSWHRHKLIEASPYQTSLLFDSDLIFQSPIDDLWSLTKSNGLLLTRFYAPPWGIDGSEIRPCGLSRVGLLKGVRELVAADTFSNALNRMLVDRIDINIGVMGVERDLSGSFLNDLSNAMEKSISGKITLLDEMLVVALSAKHSHYLADEAWNCPADEFFRRTNLADAHIIHYFADNERVGGARLGRNPATWAGKKWYINYKSAANDLNLRYWQKRDPMFIGAMARTLAHGLPNARSIAKRSYKQRKRSLCNDIASYRLPNQYRPKFIFSSLAIRALEKSGYRTEIATSHKATVIILSYKRVKNIPVLVRNALLCDFVERVIVSNNNPDLDISNFLPPNSDRFELIQHKKRRWPSLRYNIAQNYTGEYFICIDDDVFPSPWQLRALFLAFLSRPNIPHGSAGQNFRNEKFHTFEPNTRSGRISSQSVDVILQIYIFSRQHLKRYFELLDAIGERNENIRSSEDVLLSFAGDGPPFLQSVGSIMQCRSAIDPLIATWRQKGFIETRKDLFQRLNELDNIFM
ncbi:MAG: hypothetical protein ACI9FD_000863 [Gammaproteobacteria bacterium]